MCIRDRWYIIPDHHPAIVEKAVFDTVQASQLRFSQPNKKKRDYQMCIRDRFIWTPMKSSSA